MDRAPAEITVFADDGRPVGRVIVPPQGPPRAEVTDERGRERVEAVARHLGRVRPPRPRPSCP